jgi:hypothetical protein
MIAEGVEKPAEMTRTQIRRARRKAKAAAARTDERAKGIASGRNVGKNPPPRGRGDEATSQSVCEDAEGAKAI